MLINFFDKIVNDIYIKVVEKNKISKETKKQISILKRIHHDFNNEYSAYNERIPTLIFPEHNSKSKSKIKLNMTNNINFNCYQNNSSNDDNPLLYTTNIDKSFYHSKSNLSVNRSNSELTYNKTKSQFNITTDVDIDSKPNKSESRSKLHHRSRDLNKTMNDLRNLKNIQSRQ